MLAGRMLAPLTRITTATRIAGTGSLSHRVRLEGRRDEFTELADAFDAMLAQLEAHLAEQQRFAADASHELRTPLAVTQTLLDVARRDPDRDTAELLERLHAVNARAIGAALRRARRPTDARDPLRHGLELADALGAGRLIAHARHELRAAGVRTRSAALSGPDALTPAERRVVERAAAGRTNHMIAEALFVTDKTVELHLRNAYRKLGVRSRRELPGALHAPSSSPNPGGPV
ncbi:MAG: histidine kinase [Solirubrobacterales bacterium]|nr:histidine kinase [Solirubrobacterales bacterium]